MAAAGRRGRKAAGTNATSVSASGQAKVWPKAGPAAAPPARVWSRTTDIRATPSAPPMRWIALMALVPCAAPVSRPSVAKAAVWAGISEAPRPSPLTTRAPASSQ
jgi:hypothetical protein